MSHFLSLNLNTNQLNSLLFEKQTGLYSLCGAASQDFDLRDPGSLMPAFREMLQTLETESGTTFLDKDHRVIHTGFDGTDGLNAIGFSFSAARPIRVALIGISEAYSLSSLRRLVSLFDAEVVLEMRLQDPLSQSQQLQALSNADIEMLVIAGGSEEGASRALRNAIENTRLFYHIMPKSIQPQIVYAGNQILADYARIEIEAGDDFHLAPNLRNAEGQEDLSVAWKAMLNAYERVRLQQYPQLRELRAQLRTPLMPASFALGRMARFIAKLGKAGKSVLLADLSEEKTTLLLANEDGLMATSHPNAIDDDTLLKTQFYCSQNLSSLEVAEYLHNKKLFPQQLAVTISDFAVEQAWSRANLWRGLCAMKAIFPGFKFDDTAGLKEDCDPIILSGSRLSRDLEAHQILAVALDGFLPHSISTFALDEKQILVALGALAEKEPLLVVQMLELESFRNLASVVSLSSQDYEESSLLDLEMVLGEEEARAYYQVSRGQLLKIETAGKEDLRVYLAPSARTDLGMGMPGLGGWITVPNAELGLVIDARERPISISDNPETRAKKWRDWLWELGG
ncbi:MAG: hypothetical protein GX853_05805 [Chloroflexi bacterium]|nr:hypothetical protein [Chloroflexota bacterium]